MTGAEGGHAKDAARARGKVCGKVVDQGQSVVDKCVPACVHESGMGVVRTRGLLAFRLKLRNLSVPNKNLDCEGSGSG